MCDIVLFADDTNIFIRAKTRKEAYDNANKILRIIQSYMKSNKLHINLGKSCYMEFKKKNTKAPENQPEIIIGDTPISRVTETKFLGVIIDDQLSWLPHIKKAYQKTIKLYWQPKQNKRQHTFKLA